MCTPQSLSSQLQSRVSEEWPITSENAEHKHELRMLLHKMVLHIVNTGISYKEVAVHVLLYALSPSPLCMDLVWQLSSYRCQGTQLRARLASRLTGVRKLPCT